MAKFVETTIKSDFSGKKGATTYKFTLNGTRYTVDLTESEWNEQVMTPLSAILTFSNVVGATNVNDANGEAVDPTDIREWAKANGWDVKDRGKLAQDVKDAFAQAHGMATEDVPADA